MNIGNSLLSLLTVVALIIVGEVLRLKFSKKLYFGLSLLGLGAAYYFINANDSSLNIFASQMQYSRLGGFFVSIFIGLMFSVFLVLLFQKHMLPRSVELTLILFLMLVGAIVAVFLINVLNFFVAFELVLSFCTSLKVIPNGKRCQLLF
jgi:formate hydrogenlyase subunit 3/multisubunit Na+/H+ antiporter MnhD subunit